MTERLPSKALAAPLCVYLVYHPDDDDGRRLAAAVHDWLRLVHDDGDAIETGVPSWYRCRLDGEALSPSITWDAAVQNLVVVLASDAMVAEPTWRKAVTTLSEQVRTRAAGHPPADARSGEVAPATLLLPVAIHRSGYRLQFLFDQRGGLPAGPPEAPIDARARVLRRAVTEAAVRTLRSTSPNDPAAPPVPLHVFLSHAKADGATVATRLRDGFASYGQLKPWFDQNELVPGYRWAGPIKQHAKDRTAALIAVVSEAYATRPWCRLEVNAARSPRRLDVPSKVEVYTTQPSVAVVASDGAARWSRPMAQLAQVPHLRWTGDSDTCIGDIVDRLLLETLLAEFHRAWARRLAGEVDHLDGRVTLLTWAPDPWTVVTVRAKAELAGSDADKKSTEEAPDDGTKRRWTIAHPGHGLRTAEAEELGRLLEAMDGPGEETVLIAQERLLEGAVPEGVGALVVAISASGAAADLEPAGLGVEHVHNLLTRLARRLLDCDCRLAFGGTLSIPGSNLTRTLVDAAASWYASRAKAGEAPARHPPPLLNWTAWPWSEDLTVRQRAELHGICEFHTVELGPQQPWRRRARSLSEMRRQIAARATATVVVGGRIRGWTGWMPGVLEEVASALAQGKVPLIVGRFGGCAGELADFLRDPSKPWPSSLSLTDATELGEHRVEAGDRFAWARGQVSAYRDRVHGDWDAPVDRELVLRLLDCGSPSEAIRLVLAALAPLAPRREPAAPASD